MNAPLEFQKVSNVRDLGGRLGAGGRRVAFGRIYRSASPHEMSDADRALLRRMRVTTLVDLRSDWERREQHYEADFARIVHAPLVHDAQAKAITEGFLDGSFTSEELANWWDLTGIFDAPEEHAPAVRRVFEELLALPQDEALLFHCRGGKDRTGLIAMLILHSLGVSRERVREDFVLSDALNGAPAETEDVARMRAAMHRLDLSPAAVFAITSVRPEWLDRLIDGIESRHGSVRAYITDHLGIGEGGIRRLRSLYLED